MTEAEGSSGRADEPRTIAAAQAARVAAEQARRAAYQLAPVSGDRRNAALEAMARAVEAASEELLAANALDLEAAAAMQAAGELGAATVARLRLTPDKVAEMAAQVRAVRLLADPLGQVLAATELDAGLELEKWSVPLGVLLVIFEARPDAVTQIAALALKSGNAVLLKPGREVEHTAAALVERMREAIGEAELPPDAVTMVRGRDAVAALLGYADLIDMVIPRGSRELVEYVQRSTRIPVLGHAEGVCHVFVDASADREMAIRIVEDAKCDYPAACNAVETVLVHRLLEAEWLPRLAERLAARGVRLLGDTRVRELLAARGIAAGEVEGWRREYGELTLALRVVDGLEEALEHIRSFGSAHTEAIVTEDRAHAERFLREVDAAGVFHNASTRFADGFRYGFGAEVGVSTSKLHARGPVGLDGLTTYKYVLRGAGQGAGEYRGAAGRRFTHRKHGAEAVGRQPGQ